MASHRVRELYDVGGCTVYRLRNTESIEEGLDNLLSIPHRYNSCCSRRAVAVFGRRSGRLASTADKHQNMTQQYVRTPRVVRVVKSKENRGDHQKRKTALPFSTVVNWSSRIYRMAIVEQKKNKTNPVTNNRVNLNSSCPVDHPRKEWPALLRFSVVTAITAHGDHLDHFSGEVTL